MVKKALNITVPVLIDSAEFHPTCVMQKVLLSHIEEISDPDCEKVTNPPRLLTAMGHDRSNWYKWQIMPGFKTWWSAAIMEQLGGGILERVHQNLARLAMTQRDSSTIKLFLERFDPEYKPAIRQELRFDGVRPSEAKRPQPEIDAAIARSRARAIACKEAQEADSTESDRTDGPRPPA